MARDINIPQITNHVIYLYNQPTETSDKCNLKQNYVLGGQCTVQLDCALTALLTTNMQGYIYEFISGNSGEGYKFSRGLSPPLPLERGSGGITPGTFFEIYIAVGVLSCFFEVIK